MNLNSNVKSLLRSACLLLVIVGILLYLKSNFLIATVDGSSMQPTIYSENKLFVSTKAYDNKIPSYKDIILLKEDGTDTILVKRVIATPGDTLEIKDNIVYLNGEILNEPYIFEEMNNNEDMSILIPDGYVFVMGDNRNVSRDSRNYSIGIAYCKEDVIGKVIYSLKPFGSIE